MNGPMATMWERYRQQHPMMPDDEVDGRREAFYAGVRAMIFVQEAAFRNPDERLTDREKRMRDNIIDHDVSNGHPFWQLVVWPTWEQLRGTEAMEHNPFDESARP